MTLWGVLLHLQRPPLAELRADEDIEFGHALRLHRLGVPLDLLAREDGEVAEQDRLGERAGVVGEVGHRVGAAVDCIDELGEVAGRLDELETLRLRDVAEQFVARPVVAGGVERPLVADE